MYRNINFLNFPNFPKFFKFFIFSNLSNLPHPLPFRDFSLSLYYEKERIFLY
jgi:hypothetical protein